MQKNESKSSNVTQVFTERSGSYITVVGQPVAKWIYTDKLLLVAEVGVVFVVSAKVSIIRGGGTEEDGRREVVFASFEVLVHLTWDTRLDGHSVALKN